MRTASITLEERVQELEDEVADLKAEVRKAWRVIRELRAAFTPGEDSQSDSRSHPDSRCSSA